MRSRGEIRREERKETESKVRVSWEDSVGRNRMVMAHAYDVSESGLSIEMPDALPLRSIVQIHAPTLKLLGTASVRYCGRKGLKFVVGLEFTGGLKWRGATVSGS